MLLHGFNLLHLANNWHIKRLFSVNLTLLQTIYCNNRDSMIKSRIESLKAFLKAHRSNENTI